MPATGASARRISASSTAQSMSGMRSSVAPGGGASVAGAPGRLSAVSGTAAAEPVEPQPQAGLEQGDDLGASMRLTKLWRPLDTAGLTRARRQGLDPGRLPGG